MDKLLVTGGGGRLGRLVIDLLLARGLAVIATTRNPDALADLAARGVEVRHADHDRPETLDAAFRGARAMLIISSFSLGSRAEQMRRVVGAAKAAGVSHVCYTSGTAARPGPDRVTADHFWSEQEIIASGLEWTMLRHNMYMEHVPMTLALGIASGVLHAPIGDAGRGYVTREDCARADAGALASAGGQCRIVDVTGPDVVTHHELAASASRITGCPVRYEPVSQAEATASWRASGIPAIVAEFAAEYDAGAAEGHAAIATSAVRDLGGREPEGIESFLTRHRDLLMPGPDGRAPLDALLDL